MADMGAEQHTEIGPVGWLWVRGLVEGSTELGTDPEERLEGEVPIDKVYSG